MTRFFSLFALLALVPAALNGASPRSMQMIAASCGGGSVEITIPLRPGAPDQDRGGQPCCAKGCHTGNSRKKLGACC